MASSFALKQYRLNRLVSQYFLLFLRKLPLLQINHSGLFIFFYWVDILSIHVRNLNPNPKGALT